MILPRDMAPNAVGVQVELFSMARLVCGRSFLGLDLPWDATLGAGGSPQAQHEPVPLRPAYGHSKDRHDDLKQVLLSLGVSSEGLPLRMGLRDGNTSDSTGAPVAIAECLLPFLLLLGRRARSPAPIPAAAQHA